MSDAIDFEHLLSSDDTNLDRQVALFAVTRAASLAQGDDRRSVFLAWVRFTRDRTAGALPGELFRRARSLTVVLLTVTGFGIGAALAGSLLARRDAEPVNALLFLGCTVGLQLGFLIAVGLVGVLRAANVGLGPARDFLLTIVRLLGRAVGRLEGPARSALRARWGDLDLRSERLGPLIACQLLVVTQSFALAFNGGLVAAMLLIHLPFEELRFGWQSTYSFTTTGVETAIRATAAPWSWLSPTLAPDAADIAATRFARGQRAETLPPDAAHAWWPFLIAAILFYGFAIRLLLALAAQGVLLRRLRRLTFTQPSANALWRRLAGPLMRPAGGTGRLPSGDAPTASAAIVAIDLLIVDREWGVETEGLRLRIEGLFHGPVSRVVMATIDDDALPEPLAALSSGASSVVVATPAGRDPIVAVADFLQALAKASRAAEVAIALVPDSDAAGGVSDVRLGIWRRFVAIQRLPVSVERLP